MPTEQARKEWRAGKARDRFHDEPCFVGGELVLGASTVLAKSNDFSDFGRAVRSEARLKMLLSAAYGASVSAESIGHLKAATRRWRAGDAGQAELHLALSRLGKLDAPFEASRRLAMVDDLMRAGLTVEQILSALAIARSAWGVVRKYDSAEPRIPAGNGRPSGRWTSGGGGAVVSATPIQPVRQHPAGMAIAAGAADFGGGIDLAGLTTAGLARLAAFVGVLAEVGALGGTILVGGVAAAVGIVVWSDTGPKGKWITADGAGNVSFFVQPDETAVRFRITAASGVKEFTASPDPDGNYRDPDGNPIAKWVKTGAKIALVISLAALGADKDKPSLCPARTPDKKGARPKDQDFEDFMKVQVNPQNPTPRGMAFQFYNPKTDKMVNIDDCQQSTGIPFEYKGTGYSEPMNQARGYGPSVLEKLVKQATAQVQATDNRPLRVWVFAEKSAADQVRATFENIPELKGRFMVLDVSQYEKLKWEI